MFEPKVKTDISSVPSCIETNLGDLEPIIAEKVALAQSLVVNPDKSEVARADADAAEIGKLSERIKRFRIDFVAWWKKPLANVESKCKEYEKRLTDAAACLRSRTEEIKDTWRAEKIDSLRAEWNKIISSSFDGYESYLPKCNHFEDFFLRWTSKGQKGAWINAGTSIGTAVKQMKEEVGRCMNAIALASQYFDGAELAVARKSLFEAGFSEETMLREVKRYRDEQNAIITERERAKEREEASGGAIMPETRRTPIQHEPIDLLLTFRLSVTGTRSALLGLKAYAEENGITIVNLDRVDEAN